MLARLLPFPDSEPKQSIPLIIPLTIVSHNMYLRGKKKSISRENEKALKKFITINNKHMQENRNWEILPQQGKVHIL